MIENDFADLAKVSPSPPFPVQTPEVYRLRQMLNLDLRRSSQIRPRPGHLQNPVISPRRKLQPLHRLFDQHLPRLVHLAHLAHHPARHLGVGVDVLQVFEAFYLHLPGLDHPLGDVLAAYAGAFYGGELVEGDGGYFHVEVNAIQQRPGDLAEVALDDGRAADAFLVGVVVVAAGAGVYCLIVLF